MKLVNYASHPQNSFYIPQYIRKKTSQHRLNNAVENGFPSRRPTCFRKLSSKLNSALMPSLHDEIGQLCISPLKLFLYSKMDLVETLLTRAKQYSIEGVPKSSPPHCIKLSRKLNSALMPSFHDEISQLCISTSKFFNYSTMDLVETLSTQAKKYIGEESPKSSPPHCIKLSSKLNSALMLSFHDEIGQLFISSFFASFFIPHGIWTEPFQQGLNNTVEKGFPNYRPLIVKIKEGITILLHHNWK